jgi:hypothetical protein
MLTSREFLRYHAAVHTAQCIVRPACEFLNGAATGLIEAHANQQITPATQQFTSERQWAFDEYYRLRAM